MPPKMNSIAPTFLVADVVRAAEYYRDKLGFELAEYFGDPPEFTIVRRGEARVALRRSERESGGSNRRYLHDAIDAYVWADGVEDLHREFVEKGAEVILAPTTRVYGLREIEVRDLDGYVLSFGEPVEK
jgi:catechol 2,3-dioxygenase-like lactoylglutathione lyase family enzyme